jgi:hypothetical protein
VSGFTEFINLLVIIWQAFAFMCRNHKVKGNELVLVQLQNDQWIPFFSKFRPNRTFSNSHKATTDKQQLQIDILLSIHNIEQQIFFDD